MSGLGLRVWGLGLRGFWCVGSRIFRVYRIKGILVCRVQGLGFRVLWCVGLRV